MEHPMQLDDLTQVVQQTFERVKKHVRGKW
jgi:hypothetical protein